MNFQDFTQQLSKIKNLPLPGAVAHYKMAPEMRINELKTVKKNKYNPKKAAVMALFYADAKEQTRLLLILRKTYKGVHSNQIGFPGGKAEKQDTSILETALRETHEEVGVAPSKVTVIRSLSEIYIPPSNFDVQPYLGLYSGKDTFIKQEREVEALVKVPLIDFLDDSNVISHRLSTSYSTEKIVVPAFKLNGYIVWGATAMMLNEIKALFKQVL